MISVGYLKELCSFLEFEWGSDSHVIIQFIDEEGNVIEGSYCCSAAYDKAGNLFLRNRQVKEKGENND